MMDGIYKPNATAAENVAGIIRATHDGMCSDGSVRYSGVPSTKEILAEIGVGPNDQLTEAQWVAAYEAVEATE
jgi:hypothetical protein